MGLVSLLGKSENLTVVGALITIIGAAISAGGVYKGAREQEAASQKLSIANEEIARLSKKALSDITGGDSFCRFIFQITDFSHEPHMQNFPAAAIIIAANLGESPVYDIKGSISKLERWDKDHETQNHFQQPGRAFNIGNLPSHANVVINYTEELAHRLTIKFHFDYSALNGVFNQITILTRVQGRWQQATRIRKFEGKASKELLRDVPPDFPIKLEGDLGWADAP